MSPHSLVPKILFLEVHPFQSYKLFGFPAQNKNILEEREYLKIASDNI